MLRLKRVLSMMMVLVIGQSATVLCGEAGDPEANLVPTKTKGDSPGFHVDHTPFVTASISDVVADFALGAWPTKKGSANFAYKGITIKLDGPDKANMCFDTDLMRMAFGWSGGYLKLENTMLGQLRGTLNPSILGTIKFSTSPLPGWALNGDRTDPRKLPYGPLPKTMATYKGLYLHNNQVVLSYTVGDAAILELPAGEGKGDGFLFTRTINIQTPTPALSMFLADLPGATGPAPSDVNGFPSATLEKDTALSVAIAGAPKGATLSNANGVLELKLPALTAPTAFKVMLWSGAKGSAAFVTAIKSAAPVNANLAALCKGGQSRWAKNIDVTCSLGADTAPYTADVLGLPIDNPWKAWVRSSGFDFLPDGRIALCEITGDVWVSSPLTPKLDKLSWKRFATGMFEPLGLRVVDGKIYVLGRDQITRLHDLDGDGEADFYENFNNDRVISPNYHAFAFDLQTDSAGNFYYAVCGHRAAPGLPDHACMIRVSKDGSKMDVYASGIRSPNGLGMSPSDVLTYGDNQGNYTPSSKVTRVKQGGFYGYKTNLANAKEITSYEPPIFWLPMVADNSCGGQTWVPDDRWGPYKGQMIHLSYGKASAFLCFTEEIDGVMQGGAIKLPLQFGSGTMRARFNPADGQLYVAGTRGWQTSGSKDGTLARVRYTGKPAYYPTALHVKPNGVELTFPNPLDTEDANDKTNYNVEQWNYLYSPQYGSAEYSVADPKKKGHDAIEVKSVKLSNDKKTLFLELGALKPVNQMSIKFKVKFENGPKVSQEIFNTLNVVPKN